jgi:hypothetical protein
MNRTRPCWTKIAEQLIHVAAAVIQALKRLGLPPPRSAATGMPRRPLARLLTAESALLAPATPGPVARGMAGQIARPARAP